MVQSEIEDFTWCSRRVGRGLGKANSYWHPAFDFTLTEHSETRSVHRCDGKGLSVESTYTPVGCGLVVARRLTNTGTATSEPVDTLEPLCLVLGGSWLHRRHIYANGGTTENFYPPTAYRTCDWSRAGQRLKIESHSEGRSSNLHLPLIMSLADAGANSAGLFCGMEWSGAWYMQVASDVPDGVRLMAGVKVRGLTLEPGENLDLPPVHVGFFEGGPVGGTNALRRYLYENVCARYHGKLMMPFVSYDHWFGIANGLNLDLMKKEADRAGELGVEIFVVDAAWFPGDFPLGVGNWDRVDTAKFPDGLEPLAEYVRGLGMGFGLWFEPERAVADTSAVVQHPDLFVEAPSWGGKPFYHINLARKEAQDYLIEAVGHWIGRLDLRWSRWDYNIEPREPWAALDPTGKIQFAYMKGLYRVLDTLMERYPDWTIEGCASGGRRIDIGTMKRAHTYWFSDQTTDPHLCRYMQARANRFLPGHLCNSSVAVDVGKGDAGFDDTAVLSRMLGKLAFDGDVASWSPELTTRMAAFVAEFKAARHLMVQDFYQLLPMPTTAEDWDAVEFAGYDGDEAALFVFAGCEGGDATVVLRGLNPDGRYAVAHRPDGSPEIRGGKDLMEKGLHVTLGPLESGLWSVRVS